MSDGATSVFAADTRVEPAGSHRFTATITDRWTGLAGAPLGGYVLAVALAALRRDMTAPDPQVVSAYCLDRVAPGPVEIRTELVRSARHTAVGEARLLQGGREALRALATFTDLDLLTGRTLLRAKPPALPPPQQAVDMRAEEAAPNRRSCTASRTGSRSVSGGRLAGRAASPKPSCGCACGRAAATTHLRSHS